jgi:exosortase E/protease (VPEID-CTERM system)
MRLALVAAAPVTPAAPTTAPALPDSRPTGLPVARWVTLTVLLLAEIVGLSMAFDAGVRTGDAGWAGTIIFRSPYLLRAALVVLLVVGGLGLWQLRDDLRAAARSGGRRAWEFWALAHLGAFALFVLATERVLGQSTRGTTVGPVAVVTWLATGVLTVGLWAAAMIPPSTWPTLLRRARGILLAGVVIGIVALPAALLFQREWEDLSLPTLWFSSHLIHLVTRDAVCDPETRTLGTSAFQVTVAPQCSGYEGMGLIGVFLGAYLILFRRDLKFPRALLLVPVGMAAVWVLNAVRIAGLVLMGDRVSPALAMGGFHSQAGWLGFSAVAVGLVAFAHRSQLVARNPVVVRHEPSPTLAYLAPLLTAVLVEVLAVAFVPDPGLAYPVRVLAAGGLLAYFWPRYHGLRAEPVPPRTRLATIWGVAAGIGVYFLWIGLARTGLAGGESAEDWSVPDAVPTWAAGPWLALSGLGFVLVTPLVEELAFRGYLMRRLVSSDFESVPPGRFTWQSFLGSSVPFGLLHGEWVSGTLAGMVYALVVVRTGRLREAVLAHAITNALLFLPPILG